MNGNIFFQDFFLGDLDQVNFGTFFTVKTLTNMPFYALKMVLPGSGEQSSIESRGSAAHVSGHDVDCRATFLRHNHSNNEI